VRPSLSKFKANYWFFINSETNLYSTKGTYQEYKMLATNSRHSIYGTDIGKIINGLVQGYNNWNFWEKSRVFLHRRV